MPFPLEPELDYLCFSNPSWFARLALGFSPDPHQERVLTSLHPRRALCCSRQWGKSTLAAVLAVHRLVYGPPGNTSVIVAPALRQSRELLRKMRSFVRTLGFRPRGDGDNPHSLMLPNASRVVAVPARDATTRGFSSVSLLILDEAARIPDFVYYAFRPMLAVSQGDLLALSTPAGRVRTLDAQALPCGRASDRAFGRGRGRNRFMDPAPGKASRQVWPRRATHESAPRIASSKLRTLAPMGASPL
ncbi:MAG: hypothetical protein ACKV22_08430 [Bryobacteraceae bacterium]